jgi:hypothetical protein
MRGMFNHLSNFDVINVVDPEDKTTTFNVFDIDLTGYVGVGLVILQLGVCGGTGTSLIVKLREHNTAGGADVADIPNTELDGNVFATKTQASDNTFETKRVNLHRANRYFAITATIAGTSPTFLMSVCLILPGKQHS